MHLNVMYHQKISAIYADIYKNPSNSMIILYLDLYCLLGSVVEVIRIYHCNFCLSSILSSTFTNLRLKEFSISCGE